MAQILDGRIVRDEIAENLKSYILNLKSKPKLVIIQIGDLTESNAYINQKIKFGERIGAAVELKQFPEDVTEANLTSYILNLNSDPSVHGVIIQMPIPNHLDKDKLIELIDPKKDVDGLTSTNQKLLYEGKIDYATFLPSHSELVSESADPDIHQDDTAIIPATAKGVITLLNYYKIPIKNKKVTVVGRSKLVGAPLATLFRNLGAEVTVCHSQTIDLKQETRNADIIAVAVGKQNLIGKDHVFPNQVIIDVGINVIEESDRVRPLQGEPSTGSDPEAKRKLTGDVNFAEVEPIVAAITPVPGGIGPMTVASLFENLLEAYKTQP